MHSRKYLIGIASDPFVYIFSGNQLSTSEHSTHLGSIEKPEPEYFELSLNAPTPPQYEW